MGAHFLMIEIGGEYGTHYRFDEAGDGIGMHSHQNKELWHDIVCVRGSVEVYGDELDAVLKPGDRLKITNYRMHEIRAMEPNAEVFHPFLNGRPEGYENLPADQISGHLNTRPSMRGKEFLKCG